MVLVELFFDEIVEVLIVGMLFIHLVIRGSQAEYHF